jgi:hypothetical protein
MTLDIIFPYPLLRYEELLKDLLGVLQFDLSSSIPVFEESGFIALPLGFYYYGADYLAD